MRVPAKKEPASEAPLALKHAEAAGEAVETPLARRDEIIVGRGVECDVVIKDAKASRRHCKLVRKGKAFELEDLASKNGTFVEGHRITGPVLLKADQAFKVGDTVFYLSS